MSDNPITSFRGEYSFLSNFYESPFEYNGPRYKTVEHAYQAHKNPDTEYQALVRACEAPGEAKKLGRDVALRQDWNSLRLLLMEAFIYAKFVQNRRLIKKLLATGNRELVEGNIWGDTFWGVCNGKGKNNLGKILMKVRGYLKSLTKRD